MRMPSHSDASLVNLNDQPLLYAALAYVSKGWPVLPLVPKNKNPLTSHGLLDSSTDPDQIRAWWNKYREANIGIRTGIAFDVLDIDGEAGSPAWQSIRDITGGQYIHTGPVASTGKGYHLLFEVTGARNTANKLPGLDFRGQNGYIVASPSIHPSGHRYQWVRDPGPLPEAPGWLEQLLTPPKQAQINKLYPPENMEDILSVFELWKDEHPLRQIGQKYITNCIFHDDSTPSLVLYPENNSFYCFGCNEWGDSLNLRNYINTGSLRNAG